MWARPSIQERGSLRLDELLWDEDNEEHIARHGVRPEEVEEVVFDRASLFLRTRREEVQRYLVLGLTEAGRALFVVLEPLGQTRAYVVSARDMTDGERRRFKGRRR
ncbi:MAG TPA: BrnT family toxin [Actinomycetota bacterium]|nr:BrnT family toxin [Actinomycetota bacterium]